MILLIKGDKLRGEKVKPDTRLTAMYPFILYHSIIFLEKLEKYSIAAPPMTLTFLACIPNSTSSHNKSSLISPMNSL